MKKKKNKSKITLISLSIIWIFSLCAAATYAWVARSWTPTLEYGEINIATSGAIVIQIDDKDGVTGAYNEINLNDLMDVHSFALKQVSSSNGRNFLGADFNPVLSGKSPIYSTDVSGKYIETKFNLVAQKYNSDELTNIKNVFIHPDSKLTYNPLTTYEEDPETGSVVAIEDDSFNVEKAIRVSIDVQGIENPFIFCADRDDLDAKDGIFDGLYAVDTSEFGIKNSENKDIFVDYNTDDEKLNSKVLSSQQCYSFSFFDGSSPTKTLFQINEKVPLRVTVRIWLEGCDPYCVDEIAGKSFSLLLKFDCVDAPAIN